MFATSLWIALGGAIGTLGRFWLAEACAGWFGAEFPWGTVIVNITGCFIIGAFGALTGPDGRIMVSTVTRQFVMIGLCGGYTTFSAFSWQTLDMAQRGDWGTAALHVTASVALCLLAVWLGAAVAGTFNPLKG